MPAHRWRLSPDGRRQCGRLADRLGPLNPARLVSSVEPKALETAQLAARPLGLPVETAAGLHEHERADVPFMARPAFESAVAEFFARPSQRVLGAETADQAHARFAGAVARVLEARPAAATAVFTHGTVMTLFVTRALNLEPFPFWKRLGLPALAVLSLPGFELVEFVEQV